MLGKPSTDRVLEGNHRDVRKANFDPITHVFNVFLLVDSDGKTLEGIPPCLK